MKLINRILTMCDTAWYILIRSLQLSAVMLLCSFALHICSNGNMYECYDMIMTARELYTLPQAILLIAVIASACIEDITLR